MKKNSDNSSYVKSTIIIILLLTFALSVTYAWLTLSFSGMKTNNVTAGTLSVVISDESDGINIENEIPVEDSVGLSYKPYTFSITNDGNITSNYSIYLDDTDLSTGEVRMNESYIKYSLVKNEEKNTPKFLYQTRTDEGRLLDSGTLQVGQTNTYDLRMWIDKDTDNSVMSTVFSGMIRVEAEQIKE